jgi:hypothetical protein
MKMICLFIQYLSSVPENEIWIYEKPSEAFDISDVCSGVPGEVISAYATWRTVFCAAKAVQILKGNCSRQRTFSHAPIFVISFHDKE